MKRRHPQPRWTAAIELTGEMIFRQDPIAWFETDYQRNLCALPIMRVGKAGAHHASGVVPASLISRWRVVRQVVWSQRIRRRQVRANTHNDGWQDFGRRDYPWTRQSTPLPQLTLGMLERAAFIDSHPELAWIRTDVEAERARVAGL